MNIFPSKCSRIWYNINESNELVHVIYFPYSALSTVAMLPCPVLYICLAKLCQFKLQKEVSEDPRKQGSKPIMVASLYSHQYMVDTLYSHQYMVNTLSLCVYFICYMTCH